MWFLMMAPRGCGCGCECEFVFSPFLKVMTVLTPLSGLFLDGAERWAENDKGRGSGEADGLIWSRAGKGEEEWAGDEACHGDDSI